MSDDKFDAIVVGAGVAGSVAALVMARAGLDVLVIERGDSAGCKNMTGGRLYAHTLEAIIPGFAASAPVERKVTREKISFLTEESGTVAKLAMRQPFVLFKGLTFQKLCLPGAFRPGDHHNKMLRPGLCVVHASPQYL